MILDKAKKLAAEDKKAQTEAKMAAEAEKLREANEKAKAERGLMSVLMTMDGKDGFTIDEPRDKRFYLAGLSHNGKKVGQFLVRWGMREEGGGYDSFPDRVWYVIEYGFEEEGYTYRDQYNKVKVDFENIDALINYMAEYLKRFY